MAEDDFGFLPELPENIREIFMWLCQDVVSLSHKWETYLGLFGEEENRGLLFDTARAAFNVIEESLRIDMTMLICRLSDQRELRRGEENLSFDRLAHLYGSDSKLQALVKKFRDSCDSIRRHRHKLIGHSDLQTRLKPDENILPPVGRSDVEAIIERAMEVLKHIVKEHTTTELHFTPFALMGADALIFWLKKGWEAEYGPRC
jgi:hypothetical protein